MTATNRRTFSLRLTEELASKLSTIAAVLGRTQADVIRDCLEDSLDGIIAGDEFQVILRANIVKANALLSLDLGSVEDDWALEALKQSDELVDPPASEIVD